MTTELLYLENHYLKEFDATIIEIPEPKSIVLDKTAIFPRGGGQPSDRANVTCADGASFEVIDSSKRDGKVVHVLTAPISNERLGQKVHCVLDWNLRYLHMRYHTALHILSGVVFHKFNAKITGGQIYSDRARLDLALSDLSKEKVALIESEMNMIVAENREVSTYWLTTEEALQRKEMSRLSADLVPKGLDRLRVVDIVGFDAQLDGGTHVAKTGEVGRIRISRTENKGRDNKRIEIVLD
jgi:misacylated tRNA(Ala) deacylase